MNLDSKNYYEVLEVPIGCSQEEINESYIRAKNSYSGDSVALYSLMTQNECEQMVNLIEEAYSILSVPEKRKEYDRVRGITQKDKVESQKEIQTEAPPIPPQEGAVDLLNETMRMSGDPSEDFTYSSNSEPTSNYQKEEFTRPGQHSKKAEINVPKVAAFKKFSLDFSVSPDFEQEIENQTEFSGAFLKKVREYKNVSVERLAEMTRISKTYIRAIEDDNFEALPAKVYTRGFIFQYAKCLKLNPELVATSYMHYLKNNSEK